MGDTSAILASSGNLEFSTQLLKSLVNCGAKMSLAADRALAGMLSAPVAFLVFKDLMIW